MYVGFLKGDSFFYVFSEWNNKRMLEKDVFINDRHRAKPEKEKTHYSVQWFLFMILMFNASVLFVCLFDWFLYFCTF